MVAEHFEAGLDDGAVSDSVQLTEEDKQQFAQKQKKAKQVRKQMQDQQKRGQKQAHLLKLLLRYVDDVHVLGLFIEIIETDVSIETAFGIVYPLLMKKKDMIDEQLDYAFDAELRLGTYMDYVEAIIETDEDLAAFVAVEKQRSVLEEFVHRLIVYFNLDDIKALIDARGDEHVKELIRSGLRGEE